MKNLLIGLLMLTSISNFAAVTLTETVEVSISKIQTDFTPKYVLHLTTVASNEGYTIQCDSSVENNRSNLSKDVAIGQTTTGFFFDSENDCLYAINAIKKMHEVLKYDRFGLTVDSVRSKFLEVNARK
jgi:hypothetical protein